MFTASPPGGVSGGGALSFIYFLGNLGVPEDPELLDPPAAPALPELPAQPEVPEDP